MFTGLISDIGDIAAVRERAEGLRRLTIACRYPRASIADGASIACAGVCLTVVETAEEGGRTSFAVDAAALLRSRAAIGPDGIDALEGLSLATLSQSRRLELIRTEGLGEDTIELLARR